MHTLQQLLSGELKGSKTLKLSCELKTFPNEIFELADTLEILDLSGNQLSQLPHNFDELKKLKIAFFSDNLFTEFPKVLANCPNLTMIGFKSNKIATIPEHAFSVHLQWLILTNNFITEIPKSIGICSKLQKVALAGNQLQHLPIEMAQCQNIQLLRISANQLIELPQWLLTLPRLAWLACSGNPFSITNPIQLELPFISWNTLTIINTLGEGASGIISKAAWQNDAQQNDVAVKVFKGEVTSDGYPEDEMQTCILAGEHPNLVKVIGKINHHPEQKMGLVLELIPASFTNLAAPPSFDTCTRDVFFKNRKFSWNHILKITQAIADASRHLHSKGIMHGDLYAHNTLIDEHGNTIFGDFGAATIYDTNHANASYYEKIDVRAFGYLMDDLIQQAEDKNINDFINQHMAMIKEKCLHENILARPSFQEIVTALHAISAKNLNV